MPRDISPDALLDAALSCAEHRHWEEVRLVDVADALKLSLTDIHRHFRDKEAMVDALWDRADNALLLKADDSALQMQAVPERLETLVFAWLQPLAPHRRTVREMLLVRLEPGHLHIQLPTLLRLSRTVQWLRESARLKASFAWRAAEEAALTALFTSSVVLWLRNGDGSARAFLNSGLHAAHVFRSYFGPKPPDSL